MNKSFYSAFTGKSKLGPSAFYLKLKRVKESGLPWCFLLVWVILIGACQPKERVRRDKSQLTSRSAVQQTFTNPVLNHDFPDPTVMKAPDGFYYAYATNTEWAGKEIHIQVAKSADLVRWEIVGDALPQKPTWAETDFWAPHVLYDADLKKYVLFYSGESKDKATGKCLGVAFADNPTGPFLDSGTPLRCGDGFENIDPMAYQDPKSGRKLLYWGSGFKPIQVQELTQDWTAFKPGTNPTSLVWPGKEKNYDRLIEGAWLDYHNGEYYLYYSGDNCCGDKANYAVMVARANNPMGPFTRLGEHNGTGSSVILALNNRWIAPGHHSLVTDAAGQVWMVYHAIDANQREKGRKMLLDKLQYRNGWPQIETGTPSVSAQPAPIPNNLRPVKK